MRKDIGSLSNNHTDKFFKVTRGECRNFEMVEVLNGIWEFLNVPHALVAKMNEYRNELTVDISSLQVCQ